MKKLLIVISSLMLGALAAFAQSSNQVAVDSVIYVPTAALDSTLLGKDIFSLLGGEVHQSDAIRTGMSKRIARSASKTISGYRVRIFFDNKQDSRTVSESVLSHFKATHPGYEAYRTYATPFFKITVGDFRTKSEAMQLLQAIKVEYPSAFIVKENINYPVVDRDNAYVADTITVYKPKK